jgi:hypothetical protein
MTYQVPSALCIPWTRRIPGCWRYAARRTWESFEVARPRAELELSDARTTGPELELSDACATGSSCQNLLADSRGELAQP